MPRMKLVKNLVIRMVVLTVACAVVSPAAAQMPVKTLFAWSGGGGNPEGNLVFDSAGNLYGTTSDPGGTTVFQLTPNSDGTWTHNVLWASGLGADPNNVRPGVVFDAEGNLYSAARLGGNGCGTVFKLTHQSDGTWTENNLLDFDCGSNGAYPVTGVTFDTSGNLYGATGLGGAFGNGVIFQLTPNSDGSWTEKVLHHFTGGSDGAYPDHQVLVFDSTGNLYGVAALGGQGNCPLFGGSLCGTVFKLTPQASGDWAFAVLHTFTGGTDGGNPEATLVFDKSGNLYGTTYGGGKYGFGVAFELFPRADGKWGERVLHAFQGGSDGTYPMGGLIFDSAGNLFGTTLSGGNNQCGVFNPIGCGIVFKLTPNSTGWTETALARFHGKPNSTPINDLLMDSAGNLYGAAAGYDTFSDGSVFELTP